MCRDKSQMRMREKDPPLGANRGESHRQDDLLERKCVQRIIPESQVAPNPSATIASIDTIEVYVPRPRPGLREMIESATRKRAHIVECKDGHGIRAIFNRPEKSTLDFVEKLIASKYNVISRVHIAVDFHMVDASAADALTAWIDKHFVLKWRSTRSAKMRIENTIYWGDGKRARNLVAYRNRRSSHIVRLELRFVGAHSVRRAGMTTTEKLRAINPSQILSHNITAKMPMLSDRYVKKVMRATYREASKKGRSSYDPLADQYRSRIPHRVKSILSRLDAQSLTKKTRTKAISTDWLAIPDQVAWDRGTR